jgi:hypothetical protein
MQKKHPTRRPASKKRVIELIAENPDGMGRFVYLCALSFLVVAVAVSVLIYKDFEMGIITAVIGGLGKMTLNLSKLFNRQV